MRQNRPYSVEQLKKLFDDLMVLETHLETSGNENYGMVTQFIQDLNSIGFKA